MRKFAVFSFALQSLTNNQSNLKSARVKFLLVEDSVLALYIISFFFSGRGAAAKDARGRSQPSAR